MRKPRVRIERESTTITYAYLMAGARHALKAGEANEIGCAYHFMAAVVLAVFSAEAFFNHVGNEHVPGWTKKFKSSSIRDKVALLHERLIGAPVDWSRAPYQTLAAAIKHRNDLAHGKTETKTETVIRPAGDQGFDDFGPDWQACMKKNTAVRTVTDIRVIIENLHSKLGHPWEAFAYLGTGGRFITPHDEENAK